jgi:AhpD family alkylhydroperoxidase
MKYITPVKPGAAHGLIADVYKQIKRDFGALVDPFVVHSVLPRLMAAVWSACRESELVGAVPREVKETVAVTVSRANNVSFCVDAHVVMLHAIRSHRIAQSLSCNRIQRLSGPSRAAFDWSSATSSSVELGSAFSESDAAEMIGTAVFFHYMNRVAAVLLDDTPLPSSRWWLKGFLSRAAGWYFSFAANRPKAPGASLMFLPDAPLPNDMAWAEPNETLAGAWARFAHEIDRLGQAMLPAEARELATAYIGEARGDMNGRARHLVDDVVQRAKPENRGATQLVLLTALAPHQVDDAVVRDFAHPQEEQERLLAAIAWASFTAARRIGARLSRTGSQEWRVDCVNAS